MRWRRAQGPGPGPASWSGIKLWKWIPCCVLSLFTFPWGSPHTLTHQGGFCPGPCVSVQDTLAWRSFMSDMQWFLESRHRVESPGLSLGCGFGPQGRPASCSHEVIAQTASQLASHPPWRPTGLCWGNAARCPWLGRSCFLSVHHPSRAFSLWVHFHLLGQVSCCFPKGRSAAFPESLRPCLGLAKPWAGTEGSCHFVPMAGSPSPGSQV